MQTGRTQRKLAPYVFGAVIVLIVIGSVAYGVSRANHSTGDVGLSPAVTSGPDGTTAGSETPSGTETPLAVEAGVLPDHSRTPGAVAETTVAVVCHRSTRTVRPPESYTERLKIQQIAEYGYSDTRLGDYEEDHLIPLELGGDPASPKNLWPEPHYTSPNSFDKDRIENDAHRAVCNGTMPLAHAQSLMASNWVALGRELGDL